MRRLDVFGQRTTRFVLLLTLTLTTSVGLAQTATAPTTQPVNERCPVMPDEPSSRLHEITFRGVPVRLCCRECKDRFLLEPQAYLSRLPHVPPEPPVGAGAVNANRDRIDFWKLLRKAEAFAKDWQPFMFAMVAVGLLHLIAAQHVRRRLKLQPQEPAPASKRRASTRLVESLARPSTLLATLLAIVLAGIWSRESPPAQQAIAPAGVSSAARETAARFAADMARQGILQGPEFVALLDKTYYRGNDERSPELYNGGVYRTCTFHVSLRTEDGQPVTYGRNVEGQRLFVRVEIRRAPGALASHFKDSEMSFSSLVVRGPVPDVPNEKAPEGPSVHPFVVTEPGECWGAGCPVALVAPRREPGQEPGPAVQHFDGMVMLARSTSANTWMEAQYGIQYSLRIENGAVTPSSKLWMGALLWTDDLPDHRLHEWLSLRPLPEIPPDYRHVGETN